MEKKKLILKGLPASSGTVSGKVRVIFPNEDYSDFKDGEILVTTLTDPTMVAVMIKAAGIISDRGGITSHPAILSREMGIPCVVNTKDGTATLKNGANIELNGTTGEIYELDQ